MQQNNATAGAVRDLVREFAPATGATDPLPDELRLSSGGLGFDSVRVVELLLECEMRFRVSIPADLLETDKLTIGKLVAWVQRADGART
jgi:acyl carrier protein